MENIKTNDAGYVEFEKRNWGYKGDRGTWARVNDNNTLTIKIAANGTISSKYIDELGVFCHQFDIDFDKMGCGDSITIDLSRPEETEPGDPYKKYEYLKENYYGYVNDVVDGPKDCKIIELHLAKYTSEYDNWECGVWYIDTTTGEEPRQIASCNGYDGVDYIDGWSDGLGFDEEEIEEIKELVESYEIQGLADEARVANFEEATPEDNGEYNFIVVKQSCYAGMGESAIANYNSRPIVVADEDGDAKEFETYEDAERYIDNIDDRYLDSGEISRAYTIYRA